MKRLTRVLDCLGGYLLLVLLAPGLGFTAVCDFGYLLTGEPKLAALWMFVVGPACMGGFIWVTDRFKTS